MMKQSDRSCWWCAWHTTSGLGTDPIVGCGHTSGQVQRAFCGCTTAETCNVYLKDDPHLKVKVNRDTRAKLMEAIHQLVVDNGHYTAAEAIMDYFSPDTRDTPAEIACDDFEVVTEVQFGGSEGIYLDCYADGCIQPDGEKKRWHIGTYKTLETSLEVMQTLGALGGSLTYYARKYLWKNSDRYLTERELRVRALKERKEGQK